MNAEILGRTEMFTESDFSINHRYRFGRDNRFTLEPFIDIQNLFDEKNVLGVQNTITNVNFTGSASLTAGTASATNPNAGNPVSPLVLEDVLPCTTRLGIINLILTGNTNIVQQAVLNYINNRNVGTLVSPFGQPAGSLVQTPVADRVLNTYGQPNTYQGGRTVRFGARFSF